jgi:hypothetical protein
MSRSRLSRRQFVRRGLAAGSAIALPWFVPRGILGNGQEPAASERVTLGVIGTGVRGKQLIANLPDGAQVAALCDCCRDRIRGTLKPEGKYAEPLARFAAGDGPRCATFQDYRRLLDRAKLDAVIVATPDHHHVLAAMLACQAGLDIYLEKPMTLTIAEGRELVNAVERHGRILQVGSQQRSMEMDRFACRFVREGGLGRVSLVQISNYPGPMIYDGLPEEPVPDGLDWNLFCGPAALRPHNRKLWIKDEFSIDGKLWRGWDLWRDFSGHYMTNWGAHDADMLQLALGAERTGPIEVWPILEGYHGEMRQCPVGARYRSGVEVRFDQPTVSAKLLFHGERGTMEIYRNGFRAHPSDLVRNPPDPSAARVWRESANVAGPHLQNWLDAIKTRQPPIAPAEVGHRAATICHLANLSRELRRKLRWDPEQETFPNDAEATALLTRPRRAGFELPNARKSVARHPRLELGM